MSSNHLNSNKFHVQNPQEGLKLSQTQLKFMQLVEEENLKRAKQLKNIRVRNRWIGLGCAAAVLGIYSYTIYSIKQEKFLDDFDEPEKVIDIKK